MGECKLNYTEKKSDEQAGLIGFVDLNSAVAIYIECPSQKLPFFLLQTYWVVYDPIVDVIVSHTKMDYLSLGQIRALFSALSEDDEIEIERVRPHNKSEIRKSGKKKLSELLSEIEASIEEGWLYGGDIEISLPETSGKLIGHHDGLYWIEKSSA